MQTEKSQTEKTQTEKTQTKKIQTEKIHRGLIISNRAILPQYWQMEFKIENGVNSVLPGQFIMVKAGKTSDPLLGRPMGLNSIDKKGNTLGIIYQIVGKGTKLLSELSPGDELSYTGPWGNGWGIDPGLKKALLVGGGAGIAPLLPLAEELAALGCQLDIYLGASNSQRLFNMKEMSACGRVIIATIDGSLGYKGMVDELLPRDKVYDAVFTCGPKSMMAKIAAWSQGLNMPCQVSMEERMGCGIGTCMGCVCATKNKAGESSYKRICREGPVFDSREVDFNA